MADQRIFVHNLENNTLLPANWTLTTLGEIALVTRERCNPQEYPHMPFIGMEHVEAHTRRILGTVPASEMRSTADYFSPGDVLYGRLRPYLNKVTSPDFEGLCSAEFIVVRKLKNLHHKYLMYLLNSWDFVNFASHLNEGDRPRVGFDQLVDYRVPLAPLNEQRRIVEAIEALFSRLDAGSAALRRAQANLKRYKASVLKAACERQLVPQDPDDEPASELLARILDERRAKWEAEELAKYEAKGKKPPNNWRDRYPEPQPPDTSDLPELPEGWVWASVEEIGTVGEQAVLTGPFGSNLGKADFIDEGVPVLTIGCLQETGIDIDKALYVSDEKAQELERYRLHAGDLLFSRMASVGRAGLVTGQFENALINYHIMRLRLADQAVDPHYFLAYVRGAQVVVDYLLKVNHGATRDGINTNQLLEMPVALPPINEQGRIRDELDRYTSVIQSLEDIVQESTKRAERLRQSILKEAFAGRLVHQDPYDEPASILLERIRAEREQRR